MHFSEAFPEDILREIRSYPGNNQCCDCRSLDTDWCSVSHGTLICLECAGKHRSLGVLVSFVRSIPMDSWSRQQVEMMRQGGNEQIKRFFRKLEIENSPVQTLYCSKGANHYRERLKEKVGKIMSGEIKSESRILSKSNHHRNTKSQSAIADMMSSESASRRRPSVYFYNVSFADGPMGMTISKDFGGRALVSKLITGGAAECCGVRVGDHISGIAKKRVDDYDEIMHMIPCMSRPILIQFSRRTMSHYTAGTTASASDYASPGKNRSLHGSKSMANMRINIETAENGAADGAAQFKSKPKIRSPRQRALTVLDNIEEGDEDLFSSPANSKLVSYRVKLKGSPEEAPAGKINFSEETPIRHVYSAELSQTDAADSSPTVPSAPSGSTPGSACGLGRFFSADTDTTVDTMGDIRVGGIANSALSPMPAVSPISPTEDVLEEIPLDTSTEGTTDAVAEGSAHDLCKQIDALLVSTSRSNSRIQLDTGDNNTKSGLGADQHAGAEKTLGSPECGRLDKQHVLYAGESTSRKLTLQPGTPIKVLRNDLWRSAIMRRKHKDGSFKVTYRDGSSESHVSVQRMAMTVDTLKALADWHTCTTMTDAYSDEHLDAAYRATTTEDAGEEVPDMLSSPDSSFLMLGSTSNVHSFVSERDLPESNPSHEDFVVQGSEDLNSWIESEEEHERDRLSSIDSVLSADGISSVYPYGSSSKNQLFPRDGEYLVATFDQAPLGLRLSSSRGGSGANSPGLAVVDRQPEVTKVVAGGRAEKLGVAMGDALMQIDGRTVQDYAEAMQVLQGCAYPLTLQFRRSNQSPSHCISASTKSSMGIVGNILDSMGLQKGPPLAQSPPQVRRLASKRISVPAMSKDSDYLSSPSDVADSSTGTSGTATPSTTVPVKPGSATLAVPSSGSNMKQLGRFSPTQDDEGEVAGVELEFDVLFEEVELGITLKELRGSGSQSLSIVTAVQENSPAHNLGVPVDCIIVCINDEPYISHSHTIATLKHAKRPVKLRFRR